MLKNNQVLNGHTTTVPDGYYNVSELSEDVFQPLGTEINLHAPTGRSQLSMNKRLVLNSGLAKLFGFSGDRFEPGKTYIAGEPHRLAVYREICVHLAEVSSSDSLYLRCLCLSPSRTKGAGVAGQRHSLSCSLRGFRLVLFHS